MFSQLVKHEFRATRRMVPFVYLGTLGMGLVNMMSSRLDIEWLFQLSMLVLILLCVAEVILTYVLIISRYYKNLYGQEGYLMFTLPVKSSHLLLSKVLVSFIWIMLSYVVLAVAILFILASVGWRQGLGLQEQIQGIFSFVDAVGTSPVMIALACLIGYAILGTLYLLAQVFFAITVGSLSRLHKMGLAAPILTYLVLYFILQLLTLAAMIIIPIGIQFTPTDVGGLSNVHLVLKGMGSMLVNGFNGTADGQTVVIGLGFVLVDVLGMIALYIATSKIMAKHTSLR